MNKRSTTILLAILDSSQSSINYDTLCNLFKVSERTIRNDINEINQWLSKNNFSNLVIDEKGFLVIANKKEINTIKNNLLKLDTYDYRLLKEERRTIISIVLLSSNKTSSIKDLCEKTCASRATVLADIAAMKEEKSNKNIKIETAVGKGIVSKLEEKEKFELLIETINENMSNYHTYNVFINILLNLVETRISFGEVVNKLQKMDIINKYHLSDEGFRKTSIFLFVILNCKFELNLINSELNTNEEMVNEYAEEIFNVFKKYLDSATVETKKKYFSSYFSINNPFTIIDAQKGTPEVIAVVADFLRRVSKDLNEDLYKDYVLFEFLCSHITSLVERIKNNEHSYEEYNVNEIADKYPKIQKSVNNQIEVIEKFFSINLDNNDKAYIVMYIQATIYRNSNDSIINNVLIACPGSLATGELLAAQVKKYFNYNIVDVTSVDNINNYKKENVDFVLSTVLIPFCNWPVMTVTPVLHVSDITKIHTLAYEIYKNNKGRKIISKINNKSNEEEKKINLLDILTVDNIEFCDEKIDVIESIKRSGQILVKNKCIDTSYIEKIINAFNEYGPYFVISKGTTLLHAKSSNEKTKTAMSLLVCRKGVEYGVDLLDPIKLIFCFSYSETGDYLISLNQLVEIGKNQTVVDLIANADSKRQVIDIIKSHLKT